MPPSGTRITPRVVATPPKAPSTFKAAASAKGAAPAAVATTRAAVSAEPTVAGTHAFLRDGWDPPIVDVTFADLGADRRRAANEAARAGGDGPAFMPGGERLTGWHVLDGSAAAEGLADLAHAANIDIACLFAMGATRAGDGAHTELLAKSSVAREFGNIRGAFLERLPMDVVRAELTTLVNDDVIGDFLRTHGDPRMHRDLQAELHLDQSLRFWFWMQLHGRGLDDPRALAAVEAGTKNLDEEFRARVKVCFVETLSDLLDRGQGKSLFVTDLVERDLLKRSFSDDAVRLFDFIAARSRSAALAANEPVPRAALAAHMAAPTAQGLRRVLAESALAADAPDAAMVAGAVTRRRSAAVEPLVRDLLEELRVSVDWRKRDSDTAIAVAFSSLLAKHFPAGTLTLRDIAARYGTDGVDLVLSLLRGGDDGRSVHFRTARTAERTNDGAHVPPPFVDALRTLARQVGPNVLGALSELDDLAGRADPRDSRHRGPFVVPSLSADEKAVLDDAPALSLSRLAAALRHGAPAVTSLASLVRARDSSTLELASQSFPDGRSEKVARFFDDLEREMDQKGAGTSATDVAIFHQAVLEILTPLADASGTVRFVDVRATYGAAAAAWFAVVASGVEAGALGDADAGAALSHLPSGLSENALAAIGRALPDVSFSARMPALDIVTDRFGGPRALARFEVVVAQHLFPTTMGLVNALLKNGLPKDKLHLIGKSYSTHERTYAALLGQGLDVDESSRQDHNLAEDAGVRLAGAARQQLQKIFSGVSAAELADPNPRPRFVLFDEGGKLIETLHKEFPQYAKLCIGVEHTDRGMQLLEELEKSGKRVLLPVVDMARCNAKKQFESPAIGESVVFHTELELAELGAAPSKKEACVIGYGAVGKATADALRRRGYKVWVHDLDEAALARAKTDGCEVPSGKAAARRKAALAHGHLLISCTGRTTITPDEFAALLPNAAILTNAASGTHELGVHDLGDEQLARRTAPESLRGDGIAMTTFRGAAIATGPFLAPGKHRHLVFKSDDGAQHLVLRGGAVVNMTRGMPPEVIQLTLGLVLTSVLQAANDASAGSMQPGRVALEGDKQRFLVEAVEADLKKRGLPPLSAPDFRTVDPWG